jgi:hypothetical protein
VKKIMMTERNKLMLMCGAMIGVQALIAWAIFRTSWCMRENWAYLLGDKPLPEGTVLALKLGPIIPAVGLIATAIVGVAILRYKKISSAHWLFAFILAELVAFALYALGITMPAMFITYSIGTK